VSLSDTQIIPAKAGIHFVRQARSAAEIILAKTFKNFP
jgi:hypothetical protein